jgi:F0F1-type ATP synthase assembly protein I
MIEDHESNIKKDIGNKEDISQSQGPSLFMLVGLGFNLVGTVVGCTFVGLIADLVLKSYPVGTLVGLFVGIVAAGTSSYIIMKKYLK